MAPGLQRCLQVVSLRMRNKMFRATPIKHFLIALVALSPAVYSQPGRPAPPTFRAITISSEPDTIVWLDGVRFGKTDKSGNLAVNTVAAGAHVIRLRADGFKERVQPLTALQKG